MNNKLLKYTFWFSFACAIQIFSLSILVNLDNIMHMLAIQLLIFSVYLFSYWAFNAFFIYLFKPKNFKDKLCLLVTYFILNAASLFLFFQKNNSLYLWAIILFTSSMLIINLNKIYSFILKYETVYQ